MSRGVINRGLILKAGRELWPATLLFGLGVLVAEAVLSYVIPTFQAQLAARWEQLGFIQNLVQAMLGTDATGSLGPEVLLSVPWVHPAVLALVWAHAIVCATRVPAGEVDRGTMDVLLGLPVSRREVFLSETVAVIASALAVLAMGWLGNTIGGSLVAAAPAPSPASSSRVWVVLVNLLWLHLAVGGFAWLVSALSERRGKAMTVVFVLLLASFLLNYLAQFWEPAKRVSFLSVVGYYRPYFILRDGAWPVRDLAVLAATALATWTAAGVIFARRDLSTV